MEVDVCKVREHYEIYIDGNFKESCDLQEINHVLLEIKQNVLKISLKMYLQMRINML